MVLVNATSCCELSNHTTLCASAFVSVFTSCPTVIRHLHNKATVLTAQGCSAFTVGLEESDNGYSIKVTLHIYSFLLNLLFIQHLVSRETDERPFTLSGALHTSGLTHTHLKVVEGDAWLWRCEGTDRDFDCTYPLPTLYLLFGSVPHIMSKCVCVFVCIHVYSCLYAPLLTQRAPYAPQVMCCGGKCLA